MKLALHRSLTFWSGILVLTAILFSWLQSRDSYRGIAYARFHVTQVAGGFLLFWNQQESVGWNSTQLAGNFRARIGEFGDYGEEIILAQGVASALEVPIFWKCTRGYQLFIPHWLILLVFAVPWLVLLFWRARRRKRVPTV